MSDDILEKLGIKKFYSTSKLKEILLRKPGELTPAGNVITEKSYRCALAIPGNRELRMEQYFEGASKECMEDIRYNTSSVSTRCICEKMKDARFRDRIRKLYPPTEEYRKVCGSM